MRGCILLIPSSPRMGSGCGWLSLWLLTSRKSILRQVSAKAEADIIEDENTQLPGPIAKCFRRAHREQYGDIRIRKPWRFPHNNTSRIINVGVQVLAEQTRWSAMPEMLLVWFLRVSMRG